MTRTARILIFLTCLFLATGHRALTTASAATFRTPNFVITNPDPAFARQAGQACERLRAELAVLWVGKPLPGDWAQPAQIAVRDNPRGGSGGGTSWAFAGGEAFGWSGTWQGPRPRILDSVAPHEITHMILASHFRRPVPRWADEGAAISMEHASEQANWRNAIVKCLKTRRGIAFRRLFAMTEYPADFESFYAHSGTLGPYMIQQRGHPAFVVFLEKYFQTGDWNAALRGCYDQRDLGQLQTEWLAWIRDGQPHHNHVVAYGGRCRYVPGRGWQCVRGPPLGRGPGIVIGGPVRGPPQITQGEPIYVPAPTAPAAEPAPPLPLPPATVPEVCGPAQTAPGGCAGLGEIKAELADLREAIAAIKPVPGPVGPPGKDGKNGTDGKDGADGKDGPPGVAYIADGAIEALEARVKALEAKTIVARTRTADGRVLEEAVIRLADPQPALDLYLIPQRRKDP